MSSDSSEFLLGGGAKSASFEHPGTSVSGTIVSKPTLQQQTKYNPNPAAPKALEFWDNGDPKMQLQVKLQTQQRDPADPNDDGVRAIYLKGGHKKPTTQKAVADAVRAAGARDLEVGGTLTLTFTGYGPSEGTGNPPKQYVAQYQPPAAAFLQPGQPQTHTAPPADAWANQQQPYPTPPAPAQQPVYSQPGQPGQYPQQLQQPAPQQAPVTQAPPIAQPPQVQQPIAQQPPAAGGALVTLPNGMQVTPEVAALMQQVQPAS